MSNVIYCISGLGADEKIFSNLKLDGYELRYISWLDPRKNESLEDYAARMAVVVEQKDAILIGVSFGGMMGIEIAKQRPFKKIFLVSSIKSDLELPVWMKTAGKLKLDKIVPVSSFRFVEKISNDRLGVSNEEEMQMVRNYRRTADSVYVKWAINKVVTWNNNWYPDYLVHLHGDKDKIFPVKKIKSPVIIKDGTHLMIYNRAKEISEHILKELEK